MAVSYVLKDAYDDEIKVETSNGDRIYVTFATEVSEMSLTVDRTRQLIRYLQQAIADIKGNTP